MKILFSAFFDILFFGGLISDESGMITLNPAIKPLALAFNEIFPSSITLPKLCERFASKLKEQIYISLVHLVCIGAINISAHPSVAIPYKVGKSRIKKAVYKPYKLLC